MPFDLTAAPRQGRAPCTFTLKAVGGTPPYRITPAPHPLNPAPMPAMTIEDLRVHVNEAVRKPTKLTFLCRDAEGRVEMVDVMATAAA